MLQSSRIIVLPAALVLVVGCNRAPVPPGPTLGQDVAGAWVLHSVEDVEVIGSEIRVEFRKGGTILGKGPCHTGEARWRVAEGQIHLYAVSFEPDPDCPAPLQDLTDRYVAAVRTMSRAGIDEDRLIFSDAAERPQLTFRRADPR